MSLIVGYWPIRGLVETVHLVLEYLEVPYQRKIYYLDSYEEWLYEDKETMAMDFPNLPYLIDGDFKVAQLQTILKYIGRKYGLFGSDDIQELARQEELMDNIRDMRSKFASLVNSPTFEHDKIKYFAPLPNEHLISIKRFLGYYETLLSKKHYLTGSNLFIGDFFLWHVLDINECLEPLVLEDFPNLARFKEDIQSLPQIDNYLKSDKFKKFPINGPYAKWGAATTSRELVLTKTIQQ